MKSKGSCGRAQWAILRFLGQPDRREGRLDCYDVTIMMLRTQITLEPEIHRRARRRAGDLGVSLAEYVRRLVARDLGGARTKADASLVFDLGASAGSDIAGSDIARDKRAMIAESVASARMPVRRRQRRGRFLRCGQR
jgi:hypothetical protein